MRKSRSRARYLRLVTVPLLALAVGVHAAYGCAAAKSARAYAVAAEYCADWGATCVDSRIKDDLGIDQPGFDWGRSYQAPTGEDVTLEWGEIEIQAVPDELLGWLDLACYDGGKCDEDPTLCGAVVLHEIGHQELGPSQIDADCFAIRNGTRPEAEALIRLVCTFGDKPRCDAAQECL